MRRGAESREKEVGAPPRGCEGARGAGGVTGRRTLGDSVPRILITTFFLSWSTAT